MEKNLPSHQIDHYNLSSAQRRPGLLACGGATALPVDQRVWRHGALAARLGGGCTAQTQTTAPDRRKRKGDGGVQIRGPEQPQGLPTDSTGTDLIAALAPSPCYCCPGA